MAQLFARLDAGRNLHVDLLTVDARQADRAAESRRREADRAFGNEGRAFAHVDRVPLHVDEEVKVAGCRAANARFTLAGDADARAVVHARWDLHRQLPLGERAAFAVAV